MKQRTAGRLAWALWVVFMLLAAGALWLIAIGKGPGQLPDDLGFVLIFGAMGAVGALIVSRQPGNSVGWIFSIAACTTATAFFSFEYAAYSLRFSESPLPGTVWFGWLGDWVWVLTFALPTTWLLVLFPDGRLPSPRWRPFAWLIAGFMVVAAIAFMLDPRAGPLPNPLGVEALEPLSRLIDGPQGYLMILGLSLISAVSLILRYRRSPPAERQRIKWFTFAAGVLVATFVGGAVLTELFGIRNTFVEAILPMLGFLALPVGAGIGILRHRLFDIDLVISRAVVFGVLAALVTALYVGIVVGIGALVGSRGNLFLSILATALIALLFQPLRERARRFANRLVYGKRATPYEVLSEFGERLAGSYATEDVLPRLARVAGEGVGAARSTVWLHVGRLLRPAASWPGGDERLETLPLEAETLPALGPGKRAFEVRHQGELLGALTVEMPGSEALTPTGEHLLKDLAAQAGLILRNVRLIEELRASRERLVKAQDEERRRLERNIHDGAQQQLVALAVRLNVVQVTARKTAPDVAEKLEGIKREAQETLENLRDLARGIYPPLLADRGLPAALEAQARKAAVPVAIERDSVGRYPQEVEAAAYFCVLEAVQNAAKYAEPEAVTVRLRAGDGHLSFEVSDDGRGFDPATTPRGSGLQNMADRVEALGGTLEVSSRPGRGTTVRGSIPVREREAAP